MSERSLSSIVWQELHWQRPLDVAQVANCLRTWAADQRSPQIVLEARARRGQVSYFLGVPEAALAHFQASLRSLLGTAVVPATSERIPVMTAGRLRASTRHRPLRLDDPERIVKTCLSALVQTHGNELLVLQITLGPRRVPLAIPTQSPSSVIAPWWEIAWQGKGTTIDGEKRTALRNKVADHGFACTIRLGVSAPTSGRRRSLILGLLAALRTSEAAGVRLRLIQERPRHLNDARRPLLWPLRLGVPELTSLIAWPIGINDDLPGQPSLHPKLLAPSSTASRSERILAKATAPGANSLLALDAGDGLHHCHVIGPTGVGKSTLISRLIQSDIAAGRGVVVIEPKGDLVQDVLAHVPANRWNDVVILDPSDLAPVGLNPLAAEGRAPELVADSVLAIFKQLYGEAIGPRSQDILYAALLTLAQHSGASLVMLPLLLTNPGFRRSLTAGIRDPFLLEPFWASFEAWSDGERANAIAPVMNKLRPLLRPGLRGVLGQREPAFSIQQVFTERKILLVPLRRGVIGPEAASLLGSLVVAKFWQAAQRRTNIPLEQRHPVMIYVDEVQDYLHTGTDLGDVLAQARGYGVGFTLAHQFLDQLGKEMRSAVLANARSRICFQLPHEDAVIFAKGHPELTVEDFMALGQYQIYASLFHHGQVSPYVSGISLPPTQPFSDPRNLRGLSRERYGQPLDAIEAGFADLLETRDSPLGATGRRRRQL